MSEHTTGTAVDIAAINGIPITPSTQGPGSITELTIQRLLTLQGTMKPHQIISLMKFAGTDNTFAMADHDDHIHVGFRPLYGTNSKVARQVNAILKPKQWIKLIDRLGEIDNPTVRRTPSKFAVPSRSARRRRTRANSARPERGSASSSGSSRGGSGPNPGRYVARRFAGDDVRHVLVIGGIEAPRRRRRGAASAARREPAAGGRGHARDGDRRGAARRARGGGRVAGAGGRRRRRVRDRRGAGACSTAPSRGTGWPPRDPWVADADPARALVCARRLRGRRAGGRGRVGVRPRAAACRDAAPLAALVAPGARWRRCSGAATPRSACEELALRARGDLDHGRQREAALQLAVALDAALAELEGWRGEADMGERLDELAGHRSAVSAAGRDALQGGLEPETLAAVETALGRLEAALRARWVAALGG